MKKIGWGVTSDPPTFFHFFHKKFCFFDFEPNFWTFAPKICMGGLNRVKNCMEVSDWPHSKYFGRDWTRKFAAIFFIIIFLKFWRDPITINLLFSALSFKQFLLEKLEMFSRSLFMSLIVLFASSTLQE